MPNWCEGKLKIRGKRENVVRFIENSLIIVKHGKEMEKIIQIDFCDDSDMVIRLNNIDGSECQYLWIKNSKRNFIDLLGDDIRIHQAEAENKYITILNIRGAWDIDIQTLIKLSKEFDLEFKTYCFECGARFNKEIEISHGYLVKNQTIKFEDYDWECIDPTIGG